MNLYYNGHDELGRGRFTKSSTFKECVNIYGTKSGHQRKRERGETGTKDNPKDKNNRDCVRNST
jgi:hypothetical protein